MVDSAFAFRPEYNDFWDVPIWLDVDPDLSLVRGIERDTVAEGGIDNAMKLHRDRYHAAEAIYLAEVDPQSLADVIIANSDLARPALTWRRS